jgi:Ion channel
MLFKKILLTKDSEPNYLFLLIALMSMIVFPLVAVFFNNPSWVFHICYSVVILTSTLYSIDQNQKITATFVLGILALLSYWLEVVADSDFSRSANLLTNFTFFIFLLVRSIMQTLKEKNVTINTLYAVSVGYLLLGLMGFWLLALLDGLVPNSFSGNFSVSKTYDLIYFSFVTLTTLGYGDIQPINAEGKAICLLIGITGQLYISFAVAVIVGKYLKRKND